ncbi:MAG: hypothetical protein ACLP6W_13395 [Bryobacteraceae bacterium]
MGPSRFSRGSAARARQRDGQNAGSRHASRGCCERPAGQEINDSGVLVVPSFDAAGNPQAFVWWNGTMTDLNTLVPADSPLYLLFADSVNSSGEIAGFGV